MKTRHLATDRDLFNGDQTVVVYKDGNQTTNPRKKPENPDQGRLFDQLAKPRVAEVPTGTETGEV